MGSHGTQGEFGGLHRHRQQHHIRIGDRLRHTLAGLVDHAQGQRPLSGHLSGAVPADLSHQAMLTQGQGKGAAHQAASDQGQALHQGFGHG